ncbi:MAG: M1 family metallopeptidase [Kofleriaceae bacterium]
MRIALASFGLLFACGHASAPAPTAPPPPAPPPSAPPVAAAPPQAPELRLPALAKPLHEEVDLTLDPQSEDFRGKITTELEILQPTPVLWLNADEITVDEATLDAGGTLLVAKAITPKKGYLGLVFDRPLPVGKATLAIAYRGKAHKDDGDGIYRVQEGGDWYTFTQFESTDARQAFPCFDEPSYKIPWHVTLHAKKGLVAVSNTPIEQTTDEPNGMTATRFAETKPLPSYLVAFALGPFEAVDAGKTRSGAPIRIVVPRGRTGDVAYPVQSTKRILDGLEDYFGTPYPYPKLDMLAVAVFNAGAMENPGLITWKQTLLLTKPQDMTRARKETYATIAAHEMSHQWFGDEVTLAWWDDTWLNESFASWMEAKLIMQLEPSWDGDVGLVGVKNGVMSQDSLESAREIRQPIKTQNDIANAFDGITYEKGEAVLTMIERAITPDVFQKGVRLYIAKHAFGNATYDDFVAAMSEAAGKDEKPLFDSFVLQSGVPLVSVKLACTKGAPPTLELAQSRYKPTGSQIDPKRTWTIPLCVRWSAAGKTGRDCTTLATPTGTLALTAPSCPTWVLPNEGELGYYRMLPQGKLLDQLLAHVKQLTLPERVGVVGDVESLVNSGDVQPSVALQLVADLSKDKNRHIVDAGIGIVASIDDLVPDSLRPNYERLIKKQYAARAHELGWTSRPGEDENTKQLRPALLAMVANLGHDPQLIKQATELTWKWLDDHKAIQPELVGTALHIAARYGDQKLFDRIHADAKKTTDREERGRLLGAMSAFIDPKLLAQAMQVALSNDFELREGLGLLFGGFQEPKNREAAYAFIKAHFDEIAKKLPSPYRAYLAFTFVGLCDADRKAEVVAFFKPKIDTFDGGPRTMTQAVEQLELCSAQKKARTPGVIAFLKKQ